ATTVVLTFDRQLDAMPAQNPANYQIIALGRTRRSIHINKAAYNASTQTVTLRPAQKLNFRHHYRLTVVGTAPEGVTDISGNLLDGLGNGEPGSNFVTTITSRPNKGVRNRFPGLLTKTCRRPGAPIPAPAGPPSAMPYLITRSI